METAEWLHGEEARRKPRMDQCADLCFHCVRICNATLSHCLTRDKELAELKNIRMFQDCAAICITSGDLLSRGSTLHHITCAACAEICELCAANCRRFSAEELLLQCAEICGRCAESCTEMSAH